MAKLIFLQDTEEVGDCKTTGFHPQIGHTVETYNASVFDHTKIMPDMFEVTGIRLSFVDDGDEEVTIYVTLGAS
jgi:hypothetical protein